MSTRVMPSHFIPIISFKNTTASNIGKAMLILTVIGITNDTNPLCNAFCIKKKPISANRQPMTNVKDKKDSKEKKNPAIKIFIKNALEPNNMPDAMAKKILK